MDLIHICKELEFQGVELRNDIRSGDPLDGFTVAELREAADTGNQAIFSINALQRCNDGSMTQNLADSLQRLATTAQSLAIEAIVMCPVNDRDDPRTDSERHTDLAANLREFAPVLDSFGVVGLLEPLGFAQSSLRSISAAVRAIDEVDSDAFKVVLDTFHFALGTDSYEDLERYPMEHIGLVHISGVEEDLPFTEMLDDHRVLVTARDRLETCRQVATLVGRGYKGPISYEPFSASVHALPQQELIELVRESAEYVRSRIGTPSKVDGPPTSQ